MPKIYNFNSTKPIIDKKDLPLETSKYKYKLIASLQE